MEARATFTGAQVPTALIRMFMIAVLAAFLLGGAGGYLVRGSTLGGRPTSPVTTSPFVTEQPPNYSPRPSAIPEPTRDPNGFAVPI